MCIRDRRERGGERESEREREGGGRERDREKEREREITTDGIHRYFYYHSLFLC